MKYLSFIYYLFNIITILSEVAPKSVNLKQRYIFGKAY
jgi:hypothetical protein